MVDRDRVAYGQAASRRARRGSGARRRARSRCRARARTSARSSSPRSRSRSRCVSSASRPAEASRPRIVSSSGSPAATSVPNASTRIASVTGQEKSSDFIIAVRLAALKSDHMPEAPVRLTETCDVPASASGALQVVGGGDHRGRVAVRTRRDERGVPVGRDASSRAWGRPRSRCGCRSGGSSWTRAVTARKAGRVRRERRRVQHDERRGAREAVEVALDQRARLDGLRAVRLPAGAGERRLDARREDRERERRRRARRP